MQTAHLHLEGLSEADAYALASSILEVHTLGRERAPYPELMQLLAQLDYHPLAIEQVLPLLREEPLDRVLQDFSALLERCLEADVAGRNRSLLASLDYSLRRLTEAQRALLPRLTLFEGGASEDDLLVITEIPESEWQDLRRGLEQAALISPEQIPGIAPPFLRFHPVLAPALRRMPGADDPARQGRYAARYHALAGSLYQEDNRNPLPVRALVRRELPNLRRAFDLLRARGDYAAAVDLADSIAKFLNNFSLGRELADLRAKQAAAAAAALEEESDGAISQAEFLQVSGQGEDAFNRGDLQAAYEQFSALLARIEAQPAGAPRGPGSYEQCLTLQSLARCLRAGGQPQMAEPQLRRALAVIDGLIAAQPDNPTHIRQRGALLTDLGDVLTNQGRYAEARAAYEDAEQIAKEQDDTRQQGVALGQLGTLALRQRDYAEATRRYRAALELFRRMGEPAGEAVAWHQLGRVAEEQAQSVARSGGAQHAAPLWAEAERCYREALAIRERLGLMAMAATDCNQLAIVAEGAGRPTEAAGWYKRAIAIAERMNDDKSLAAMLNNLAALLLAEVRAGRMEHERLVEARGSAERALAIKETLDLSTEPWNTLNILAGIAELEGQPEQARAYRRRARETFAQFAGNRWHIDRQHGALIRDIAAVAQGDASQRAAVEAEFPKMEAVDAWRNVPAAIRRLWDGERDWHALCENVGAQEPSLLILRVLETLAEAEAEAVKG
jgi:tetratricopeptide (TPR) repeat protein